MIKNTEFENLINTLPVRIQREETFRCSCGAIHTETVKYQLKLDIDRLYSGAQNQFIRPIYRLYYECSKYILGGQYIGYTGGLGFCTFKDAYDYLLRHLKQEGIELEVNNGINNNSQQF